MNPTEYKRLAGYEPIYICAIMNVRKWSYS